jgi:hypothetical protein
MSAVKSFESVGCVHMSIPDDADIDRSMTADDYSMLTG